MMLTGERESSLEMKSDSGHSPMMSGSGVTIRVVLTRGRRETTVEKANKNMDGASPGRCFVRAKGRCILQTVLLAPIGEI